MHTTSVSLLMRLKQPGAGDDWKRFVDLYTPLLFYWARRAGLQSPDDADLVQDVFALLVEKLPLFDYDSQKSFRGWMRTIVLNKWRDQRRKMAARGEHVQQDLALLADPAAEEEFWEQEHRSQLAARALELMKADFEDTTWKACWECVAVGRPVAEVAAELSISRNAVSVAKCRVLRHLRRELRGLTD